MTTGRGPAEHGIMGNGIYWRDRRQVEMWTAPNDCIGRPQIWDLLSHHGRGLTGAVWFPLHAVGCEADYVCTPAPIHNPDGSESLWCYTRPTEFYGLLRDRLGHFPLMNYWGPLAGIQSSAWIADSAVIAAQQWQPDFFYIYLPHLDYAAQRTGPDSAAADQAVADLDEVIGRLAAGMAEAYDEELLWLVAGEYAITPVDHVSYPNRILREAGLLAVRESDDGEHLDFERSRAFAMVDHQFSHVFVGQAEGSATGGRPQLAARVADLFRGQPGIAEVLVGTRARPLRPGTPAERRGDPDLRRRGVGRRTTGGSRTIAPRVCPDGGHPPQAGLRPAGIVLRSGHKGRRKRGQVQFVRSDPKGRSGTIGACPLFAAPAIPLDARLVKGSHGAPAVDRSQRSVLLSSEPLVFPGPSVADTDVFGIVLRHFGLQ